MSAKAPLILNVCADLVYLSREASHCGAAVPTITDLIS